MQTALTPVYQRIVYDPKARLNATDILHSAIVSAVMGGALGALGGVKETEQAKASQEVSKSPIREELINPANYEKKVETSLEQSNMTKFADNVNSSMEPPQSSASDNNANSTEFLQQQFAEFLKARKVDELKKAYSENEKSNRIDQNKGTGYNENAGEIPIKPYSTSRPKYGNTQVGDVWNNYKDPMTGKAPNPAGGSISWDKTKPRQGQWDMGHIPGEKYSDMRCRYIRGEISQKEFLEWYRNPANYRPELPSTNRSHKYE